MITILPGVGRGVTKLSPGSLLTRTGGVAGGVGGNTGVTGATKGVTLIGAVSTFFGLGVISLEFLECPEDFGSSACFLELTCLGVAETLAGVFDTDFAGVLDVVLVADFAEVLEVVLEMSIKTAAKESFTDDLDVAFTAVFEEVLEEVFNVEVVEEDDEDGLDLIRPDPFFIWSRAYLL